MLEQVSVSSEISERLGDKVLAEVCECLWAMDCQTCDRPLGGAVPSLCVDEIVGPGGAVASLHHQRCRSSTWGTDPRYQPAGRPNFYTKCALVPDVIFGGTGDEAKRLGSARPTFIVNPTVELVGIENLDTGQWQLFSDVHRYLGLRTPGPEYVLGRAITAGFATLQPGAVTATLADSAWTAPVLPQIASGIEKYQGITLCMTSAIGPGAAISEFELLRLAAYGRMELGWLALR